MEIRLRDCSSSAFGAAATSILSCHEPTICRDKRRWDDGIEVEAHVHPASSETEEHVQHQIFTHNNMLNAFSRGIRRADVLEL